jgi:hypothetical protein
MTPAQRVTQSIAAYAKRMPRPLGLDSSVRLVALDDDAIRTLPGEPV